MSLGCYRYNLTCNRGTNEVTGNERNVSVGRHEVGCSYAPQGIATVCTVKWGTHTEYSDNNTGVLGTGNETKDVSSQLFRQQLAALGMDRH